MAFPYRHKHSPAGSANLSTRAQRSLDRCTAISYLNDLGGERHGIVRRRRPQQFDRVLSSNCARRAIGARAFHQVIRCCPVAMTIE